MGLLLPFAVGLPPATAFAFLLGMFAVTTMTDTIPAVLIGVPGTSQSQATYLDGFPMAKRGEAGRALSASYFANIWGVLISAIMFVICLPFLQKFIYYFAAPEYFVMSLLGLVLAGSLVGKSVFKGLMAGAFGLLLSTVGLATTTAEVRFAFGWDYLWDGIPLVPVALGMFALPEVVDLLVSRKSISNVLMSSKGGIMAGIRDSFHHRWLILRTSIIGSICGIVPGVGGSVAEWLGYGHAVQSAKDRSQFSYGDVRGVLAPESAVAAEKPGAILPTVAFGIPGNAAMALLLGAFLIHGIRPGAEMLHANLPLTFQLVWTVVIANIIAAMVCLALQQYMVLLCYVRATVIAPIILCIMAVGATMATKELSDLVIFGIFGVLGYLFKHTGWPRVPILIGLVLGGLAERYLFITINRYSISWMWERPIVVGILAIIVLSIGASIYRMIRAEKTVAVSETGDADETPTQESISLWIALGIAMLAGIAIALGSSWSWGGRILPWLGGFVMLVCAISQVATSLAHGAHFRIQRPASAEALRWPLIFLWLSGFLIAIALVGHYVAIPIFLVVFMIVHGERSWLAIVCAAVMLAFIYFVLHGVVHVRFPDPFFGEWMPWLP
jgi:putative tricarboxylic transport membrane protein